MRRPPFNPRLKSWAKIYTARFCHALKTEDEHQELLLLTNLVEVAHAVRMKHLFNLAALRGTDILPLMQSFGINQRAEYA